MTTQRHELETWLGPALDEITEAQFDRLMAESDAIDARYPHEDHAEERETALSAAVQYLLGETQPDDAGRKLTAARRATALAMVASQQIAVMAVADGMSEVKAAEATGVSRTTVRDAQGKPR